MSTRQFPLPPVSSNGAPPAFAYAGTNSNFGWSPGGPSPSTSGSAGSGTPAGAKSLKKMEATLETVLKSISQPGMLASGGMVDHSLFRPQATSEGHVPSLSPVVAPPAPSSSGVRFNNNNLERPVDWRNGSHDMEEANARLHSLPDNALNPLGLLAEASLQNQRKRPPVSLTEVLGTRDSTDGDSDEPDSKKQKLGLANFLPLRRIVIEHRMPPALLVEKIVTVEEVVELFSIFFERCHSACPILDPDIHSPTATGSRSPFLFTCICTVAARYYDKRTDGLYRKCLKVAKRVAFDVMTAGFKSTEICQGFLLLCQWNQPAERFEEERTFQFSGIAIRMATDLNLHRKTVAVLPDDVTEETRVLYEKEIQNRERTWVYCFICDRSVSNQMGKPYSIPKEDYIIRNAKTWFRQPGAQKTDVGLSAMAEMHRIVGRIVDTLYSDTESVSGLNANLDYPLLMRSFLAQLDQWNADWSSLLPTDATDPLDAVRVHMRSFYHSYYRLFLLSFAIQHSIDTPAARIDLPHYCVLCFDAARNIIVSARDFLVPLGYLRYGIDSNFVFLSYACCFLLKLVSPTFADMIDSELAMKLVSDGAQALDNCAVDENHTPALYASFLRALIDNKRNGGRTAPASRAGTRLFGGSAEGGEGGGPIDLEAFNTQSMDTMLQGGFWDNMLMPGFGGPLQGLSGGSGTMFGAADPWTIATPFQSRPASPSSQLPSFDFGPT
ncbi:hypothetical protein MNV49_005552 [Pseudohyphozyma bogoriensis]|nr:hypothetical protein MNV49_005552 [Pseudohyphozyma bogoriensis]